MIPETSRVFLNPYSIRHRENTSPELFGYGAFFEQSDLKNRIAYYEPPVSPLHRAKVDLRDLWGSSYPPIQTQGKVGACTAFAVCGAMECLSRSRQLIPLWSLSAFFLYEETLRAAKTSKTVAQSVRYRTQPAWKQPTIQQETVETTNWLALRTRSQSTNSKSTTGSKSISQTTDQNKLVDTGSTTLEALRTASTSGVADQKSIPPDFTWNSVPQNSAIESASHHKVAKYLRVRQDLTSLRTTLANGYAVLVTVGISTKANEWMHSAALQRPTYILPTPWGPQDIEDISGAHAVSLVGYDDMARVFTVRNSWGPAWGADGHFYLTYETILTPLWCRDFYVILKLGGYKSL